MIYNELIELKLNKLENMICKIKNELIELIYKQPIELLYDEYIRTEKRKLNLKTCLNLNTNNVASHFR